MTINKTTQYITNPDSIPVTTSAGRQPLSSAISNRTLWVSTLSDLVGVPVDNITDGHAAVITTTGRGGQFTWMPGDRSAEVSADEVTVGEGDGGVWVAPAGDKTGASGAWMRQYNLWSGVSPQWYGGIPADDSASSQAANDAAFAALSGAQSVIFDGYFYTSTTVDLGSSVKLVRGVYEDLSGIECADSSVDTLVIGATGVGLPFLKLESFRVGHTAKGTGNGLRLAGNISNFVCERVSTRNCAYGTVSEDIPYMQKYFMCRSVFCDEAWHIDAPGGDGTTITLDQCYATEVTQPFWFRNIKEINLIQPTWDMRAGNDGMIEINNCDLLNVSSLHVEGQSDQTLSYIIGARGSACKEIVVDGLHSSLEKTGGTLHVFDCRTTSGRVNIDARGMNLSRSTGGALFYGSNEAGGVINLRIPLAGSSLGATTSVNDSNVSGGFNYRRPASGFEASVAAAGNFATGIDKQADFVSIRVRPSTDAVPSVSAVCTDRFSGGNIKIRYVNLADGTENTATTQDIEWYVE